MINNQLFTGKAEAYARARPGYPEELLDFILGLVSEKAVFADVGAGTGKFTELLARSDHKIFAIEPNEEMRGQLIKTLAAYPSANIVQASAEKTSLAASSIDLITCAQALHWFELRDFRAECQRIAQPGAIVMSVYNGMGKNSTHAIESARAFFHSPTEKEFSNPISYDYENWLAYMQSHSHAPLPLDSSYPDYLRTLDLQFKKENVNGQMVYHNTTHIYYERLT